jgi:hypothetical protein
LVRILVKSKELKFDCRPSALIWMIDNQKNKRNANKMTLTYLIGKQYREQKKSHGGDRKSSYQNDNLNKSVELIAEKTGVGSATVSRAAIFSENLEKICENAGIKRQEILLGNIDSTMKDVNDLSKFEDPGFHKRAIDKVLNKEEKDLKRATSKVETEFREERAKQLEEEKEQEKEEEEERLEKERKRTEEELKIDPDFKTIIPPQRALHLKSCF